MARPKNKKYDPTKHHAQKEIHELDHVTLSILTDIQKSIISANMAKGNLLAKTATEKWNYPVGTVLEFIPDFQNGTVTVIIIDEVKSETNPNKE